MPGPLEHYLADVRALVLEELRGLVPKDDRHTGGLYALMLDYPLRPAKVLRPSLAIAACRIAGGSIDAVLPTAAALELYHNAFLLHDDVEDGSKLRRGGPTLHRLHGAPIAINVGDGMLALAMGPLLHNIHHLGLPPALRVLEEFRAMVAETAEGQAMELQWIRDGTWNVPDRDYVRMVYKKSTRYSFVTPITVGAYCARAPDGLTRGMQRFAALLGVAFQIQDDVLNLVGDVQRYGKEIGGDLEEGKRTLVLTRALRLASPPDRTVALKVLRKNRDRRTAVDIEFLKRLVLGSDSVAYARNVARQHTDRSRRVLQDVCRELPTSLHTEFLTHLVEYVVQRES